jgi:hypothetical protein
MKIVEKNYLENGHVQLTYGYTEHDYLREMWKNRDAKWSWTYDHDTGFPLIRRRRHLGGWFISWDGFEQIVFPSRRSAVAAWLVAGWNHN